MGVGAQDVKVLGQVFTPPAIVNKMLGLRSLSGSVLEPSAGNGAFLRFLEPDAVGIELDPQWANDPRVEVADFFDLDGGRLFDTIIGNPPYVRHQDICQSTRQKLAGRLDRRSNLYLHFIDRSIDHLRPGGEMIFITPTDFRKATSAAPLNERLYEEGSMTHWFDLSDQPVFSGAAPPCAIWRWERGRVDRAMETGGEFQCHDGQLFFHRLDGRTWVGDCFEVKVGAVSGADHIFEHEDGEPFVCSKTGSTGELRSMLYDMDVPHPHLYRHKQELLSRAIKRFTEANWWMWGRAFPRRQGCRIYVNSKTRSSRPFFVDDTPAFDGSVLAMFPKSPDVDLNEWVDALNNNNWQSDGYKSGGRLIFSQRSLAAAAV